MRLWHAELLSYLPKRLLINLLENICTITECIANKEEIKDFYYWKIVYFDTELEEYSKKVFELIDLIKEKELSLEEKIKVENLERTFHKNFSVATNNFENNTCFGEPIWTKERYLKQCLFALQELYDYGYLKQNEWNAIVDKFGLKLF
jgi:hypothetical protein